LSDPPALGKSDEPRAELERRDRGAVAFRRVLAALILDDLSDTRLHDEAHHGAQTRARQATEA